MKFKIFAVMAFVAIIFWVAPIGVSAQTREELIEGAKKEGRVVWYGSLSLEDLRKLANAFEKKYPFIKVETFRASGEKVANKIMTEVRAGRYLFDVVATGAFEIWPLQKRGMLGKYISPESKAYGSKFKAADGSWNDLYDNYYVIGWNTNMVSPIEAPKDWNDMLAEKWKGKIALLSTRKITNGTWRCSTTWERKKGRRL